tara:strand:+ start:20 stop:439 length:420 start_codon:yes stop_codon:yes gene_type:complete
MDNKMDKKANKMDNKKANSEFKDILAKYDDKVDLRSIEKKINSISIPDDTIIHYKDIKTVDIGDPRKRSTAEVMTMMYTDIKQVINEKSHMDNLLKQHISVNEQERNRIDKLYSQCIPEPPDNKELYNSLLMEEKWGKK